jgi:ubiquinone/menaquinone biosynthesis C-methylase UbiE
MARKSLLDRYLAWREERHPNPELRAHRRRLLATARGHVIEIGCGEGANFEHYPSAVTSVLAVEPDADARAVAARAAEGAPVPIRVAAGVAEELPAPDASFDVAVCSWVLCSVDNPQAALGEVRRVLRPDGELRFFEHVVSSGRAFALLQRAADATYWPRMLGGCRTARDTEAAIRTAGFQIDQIAHFRHISCWLTIPAAPHILGSARPGTMRPAPV